MRSIALLLTAGWFLAAPALSAETSAAKPLTIATNTMPAGRVNPYDSIQLSRSWLYSALYDALTYVDRDGKLTPWLAETWQSTSPTEWIFKLRPNVHFSDSRALVADDVVKTISYLISANGRTEPVAPFAANIKAAVAPDARTVKITTLNPDPALPQRLSLVRIAALPDGAAFTRENLIKSALGTGPYIVETWAPNKATFVAAPKSWRRAPTPALHAIALPDAAARKAAIVSGTADITFAAFDFAELELQQNASFVLERDQVPAVVALAFNTTKDTPFRDIRVRQAIISGVDVKSIVHALFAGHARLAHQPARHEFLGYNPDLPAATYDPEKAKRLLAEAGYAKGFEFSLALSIGGTVWDQVFQMVASDLKRLNVIMSIQMQPEPVMSAMVYNTGLKTDAMGAVFFSPSFDALDAIRQHTCSWSVAWYCDQQAEQLRAQALAAADMNTRIDLTRQLMARAHEQAQALFMYESVNLVSYSKRVKNFRSDFGFLRYDLMDVK